MKILASGVARRIRAATAVGVVGAMVGRSHQTRTQQTMTSGKPICRLMLNILI
jgi:hypothetical protein